MQTRSKDRIMFGLLRAPRLANFHGDKIRIDRLKFLFLFCPNNSGTTVLCQYLANQLDAYLPPFGNNEGQMAPPLKHMMRTDPWSKTAQFNWPHIRATWEDYANQRLFIEGSPPNMIRVPDIAKTFGTDSSALLSICNPYQHIASCLRRYHDRPEQVRPVAQAWLTKAQTIAHLADEYPHFPLVSYETFVADPRVVNRRLGIRNRTISLPGKTGSDITGIRSTQARSLGFLTSSDMALIDTVLTTAPDTLNGFGYPIDGTAMLHRAQTTDPTEFQIGRDHRADWNRRHAD